MTKYMNDTDPVVGLTPVTHDKPAPGGHQDNTPPPASGFGDSIRKYIENAVGATPINKALSKGK